MIVAQNPTSYPHLSTIPKPQKCPPDGWLGHVSTADRQLIPVVTARSTSGWQWQCRKSRLWIKITGTLEGNGLGSQLQAMMDKMVGVLVSSALEGMSCNFTR